MFRILAAMSVVWVVYARCPPGKYTSPLSTTRAQDSITTTTATARTDAPTTSSSSLITCPKCGVAKSSGKSSCCARGGAWFKNCGDPGDPNFDYTWYEGIQSCTKKSKKKMLPSSGLTQTRCETCTIGFFKTYASKSNTVFDSCTAHTKCPPGNYTERAGSTSTQPVCKPCASGFFKDSTSKSSTCVGNASRPGKFKLTCKYCHAMHAMRVLCACCVCVCV